MSDFSFSSLSLRAVFGPAPEEGRVSRELDPALQARLRGESPEFANAVLTAVFSVLLRRYSMDEAVCFVVHDERGARVVSTVIDRTTTFSDLLDLGSRGEALSPEVAKSAPTILDFRQSATPNGAGVRLRVERRAALAVELDWSGQRISEEQAHGMLAQIERLLSSGLAEPSASCLELPLLAPEEQVRLLRSFNATSGATSLHQLLFEGFEERCVCQPGALALRQGEQSITYGRLNDEANRLAHYLRSKGVRPGQLVGVCIERSIAMVTAVLAIGKAGAAYVPLEPSYPKDRVAFMLEDTGAHLVVTSDYAKAALPEGLDLVVIQENRVDPRGVPADGSLRSASCRPWDGQPTTNPVHVTDRDSLAYVIYTSGSTGRPKGVAVKHATALNLVHWVNTTYGIGPSDRLLSVASICFDLSVYDIFGILGAGASLEIATESDLAEPEKLVQLLETRGITFWDSAPAALTQLVPFFDRGSTDLRLVFQSGDWIPVSLPDQIRQKFPRARVVSLGGATEASIWSNYYDVEQVDPAWPSIPYGRPITNARYYVLDELHQPVPVGVPGRLFIGGDCLATCYFNRDELTNERFVPDPHVDSPGARMYDTGDIASHSLNGELEFLGRADNQVKVRGFRVELGEIESALVEHESVQTAICIAKRDAGGYNALFAYVVPKSGVLADVDVHGLRKHLEARLPEYMVPAHILGILRVPVTENGKLNRKALPDRPLANECPSSPLQGPTEVAVGSMFSELLDVESVGRDDNFFERGGHSLLAVQLVTRIRSRLGVELRSAQVFQSPTPRLLAQEVESSRRVLPPSDAPTRRADTRNQMLSSAQERLWFIQQLDVESSGYNIAEAFDVHGVLDEEKLESALALIVERHHALRTAFLSQHGVPRATVTDFRPRLERLNARTWDEAKLGNALDAESSRPFDLTSGALVRASLFARSSEKHTLLIVVHHIAMDGWSLRNLYDELSRLYRGEELPPCTLQYADFALWQRRHSKSDSVAAHRAAWVEQLRGTPPLELPLDDSRPPLQDYSGALVRFHLEKELVERVEALGAAAGATGFMVFFALYQALLARHSGQVDFAIGIPASTRAHAEFEPLIGFLLNTLPIRVAYDSRETLNALIARVRGQTVEALERQEVPFEDLVRDLNLARDESRPPICQAIFAYQAEAPELTHLGDLECSRRPIEEHPSRFDVTLDLQKQKDGSIQGFFEYSTRLFQRKTIATMAGHFETLVRNAVSRPESPLGDLDLLSSEEQKTILETYNMTQRDFDFSRAVHHLFEEHAVSTPERTALVFGTQEVSYAELDREAARIAYELREAGVGPGDLVGLCADRSPLLIAGMLGIFKAGAAYVPLDPTFPAERLSYMVETSEARAVLVDSNHGALVFSTSVTRLLLEVLVGAGPVLENGLGSAESLAYVMYTSGSTGKPKGVEITHRNVVNFLMALREVPGLKSDDRILAHTTMSFDISVLEIFFPLTCGGSLALLTSDEAMGGYRLSELMRKYSVNVLQTGPLALRNLLSTGWEGDKSLTVLCGGEAFPPDLVSPLVERCGRVWNAYGPTETTVWSSFKLMDQSGEPVSVGRPIANTTMYVLDEHLKPVPFGVRGELFIGGAGVANGYRGRPDLTAERFFADPFRAGERIYRTGDVASQRPDGNFEVQGRVDTQMSLNGFRIEAAEVETAIVAFSGVEEAAVIVRQDRSTFKELVGYLVTSAHVDHDELRDDLSATLPRYMIPTRFVRLDAMPKTPNGKLDRKALPKPLEGSVESQRTLTLPRTPVEEALASAFQDVLEISTLGIDDNFFDLGGSSIQTLQVIDRLHKKGIALDPGQIFRNATIRKLAGVVGTRVAEAGAGSKSIVVMQPYGDLPPLFLVHSMPGDLLGYGDLVHDLGSVRPIYGIHSLGGETQSRSICEMAEDYANRIAAFVPEGPVHLGGWCFGGTVALETASILREMKRPVGSVVLIEAHPTRSPVTAALRVVRGFVTSSGSRKLRLKAFIRSVLNPGVDEDKTFALEITEGPFANRASNYANNRKAADRHRTRSYSGDVVLVRASGSAVPLADGSDYGWRKFCPSVVVGSVPATHEAILRRPHTKEVARFIQDQLQRQERLATQPGARAS